MVPSIIAPDIPYTSLYGVLRNASLEKRHHSNAATYITTCIKTPSLSTEHISAVNKVTACHKSTFCLSLWLHKPALLAWWESGSDLNESSITSLMQLTSFVQWLNQKLGALLQGVRTLGQTHASPGASGVILMLLTRVRGLRRMRSFVWTRHEWPCHSVGDFAIDIIKRRTYFPWTELFSQRD